MFLNDIALGGSCEDILHDLEVIREAEKMGLLLNNAKSEIICHTTSSQSAITTNLPGARVIDPADATLLGSPLGDVDSVSAAVFEGRRGIVKKMAATTWRLKKRN